MRPHHTARRLAAALATAVTAAGATASAADLGSPIVSGLPSRSGASCADAAYAAWRGGRKLDVNVVFVPGDSWTVMENRARGSNFRGKVGLSAQLVVSL